MKTLLQNWPGNRFSIYESVWIMIIEIPGYKKLDLKWLLLDYNGTIAQDGKISEHVKTQLVRLSSKLKIGILTADTYGSAKAMCQGLPVTLHTFPGENVMDEKKQVVHSLGFRNCAAIGNGRNDVLMCSHAALGIAVLGGEGAYGRLIAAADVCTGSIEDALALFLNPKRLVATLRG